MRTRSSSRAAPPALLSDSTVKRRRRRMSLSNVSLSVEVDQSRLRAPGTVKQLNTSSFAAIPSSSSSVKNLDAVTSDSDTNNTGAFRIFGGALSNVAGILVLVLTVHSIVELWALADNGVSGAGTGTRGPLSLWGSWVMTIHMMVDAVLPIRLLPVTAQRVFWCAWITDVCTGAGAVPFLFTRGGLSTRWVAGGNAIAGGMMLAASGLLIVEATTFHVPISLPPSVHASAVGGIAGLFASLLDVCSELPSAFHMAAGVVAGVQFVRWSQRLLHHYEHLKFSGFQGTHRGGGLIVLSAYGLCLPLPALRCLPASIRSKCTAHASHSCCNDHPLAGGRHRAWCVVRQQQ